MKNKHILVVNFFVAFCLLLTVSRASLFCTINQGDCIGSNDFPGTLVLRISNLTNAHAELPNENNYPYRVCCNASYDKIEVKINGVWINKKS
ncbi:MAG: hypothetical protein RMH75_05460 [Archaeoglobaceae archaeon]|nr:hypothetical protein [Archaeoglobaceae archaeon]